MSQDQGGKVQLQRRPSNRQFTELRSALLLIRIWGLVWLCGLGYFVSMPAAQAQEKYLDHAVLCFTADQMQAFMGATLQANPGPGPGPGPGPELGAQSDRPAPPDLAGHPVDHYLLTVMTPTGLRVIPMQIDEVPSASEMASVAGRTSSPLAPSKTQKGKAAAERDTAKTVPGVFDGEDEFLLSTADLSLSPLGVFEQGAFEQSLMSWLSSEAQGVFELKLRQYPQASVYLWLLSSPVPQRFQTLEDRVSYDPQTHFAETDFFTLAAALDNPLVWQDVTFQGWPSQRDTQSAGTFLDTLKIRFTGNTFANTSMITITNRNLRAKVLRVRDGLLRATVDVQANMVIAGIPVMRWMIEMQFYPKSVELNLTSRTPPWVSLLLAETALSISLDGAALQGARISTAGAPVEVGMVNGKRSAVEVLLAKTQFAPGESWWLLRQPTHVQLFSQLEIITPSVTPVGMIYEDDNQLKIAPERFPGQGPNIGFKIEKFPLKTPLALHLWLRMDSPDQGYHSGVYLRHRAEPATLSISPRTVEAVLSMASVKAR